MEVCEGSKFEEKSSKYIEKQINYGFWVSKGNRSSFKGEKALFDAKMSVFESSKE